MKKLIAITLAGMMAISLAACGQNTSETSGSKSGEAETTVLDASSDVVVGGYTDAESPEITDEIKELVKKATAELDGAEYVPVAYVGSQVVAGTNRLILCKVTPVVQDPTTTYALVTIYEDLQGNAEVTDVLNSDAEAPVTDENGNTLSGGWTQSESPVVTDDVKAVFDKACETLTGAEYTPEAFLASQVVAGTNYSLFCKATATVPNAQPYYTIIHIYEDLSGNAEITDTYDFGETETDEPQSEASQAE